MLTLGPDVPDLAYAHRVLRKLGPVVRISKLIAIDESDWPHPLLRMERFVKLGWAEKKMAEGGVVFCLDPPPKEHATPKKFRHAVQVRTGPAVILRPARCVLYPRLGIVTDLRPKWCDEEWVVVFRARTRGGWLIRVIQRKMR